MSPRSSSGERSCLRQRRCEALPPLVADVDHARSACSKSASLRRSTRPSSGGSRGESWVRFVKTSTAKRVPPAAPSWLRSTSPPSRRNDRRQSPSRGRVAVGSIASGVFSPVGCVLAADATLDVRERAGRSVRPRGSRRAETQSSLPFVPVTAATSSSRDGCARRTRSPRAASPRGRSAHQLRHGTSTGCSTTSATAPRQRPRRARSWPSTVEPGTQKNSAPDARRASRGRDRVISREAAGAASP